MSATTRTLEYEISQLTLQPGDLILVKVLDYRDLARASDLMVGLERSLPFPKGCSWVVMPAGTSFENLSNRQLAEVGLRRMTAEELEGVDEPVV